MVLLYTSQARGGAAEAKMELRWRKENQSRAYAGTAKLAQGAARKCKGRPLLLDTGLSPSITNTNNPLGCNTTISNGFADVNDIRFSFMLSSITNLLVPFLKSGESDRDSALLSQQTFSPWEVLRECMN